MTTDKLIALSLKVLVALGLGIGSPAHDAATVTSTWNSAAGGSWAFNGNWTNAPVLGRSPNHGENQAV